MKGCFITQYIQCKACLAAIRKILIGDKDKRFIIHEIVVPSPPGIDNRYAPVLAGLINATKPLEDFVFFHLDIRSDIEATICHELYIAVLSSENEGKRVIGYKPKTKEKK